MKKYFEEYGKVIVIAIVILILLALVPRIGAKIQDNVLGIPMPESNTLFNLDETEEKSKITIEGPMAKGNIVTIDGKDYRVLEMSDTEAKLLAMYDATVMKFNDSSITTTFNGIDTSGKSANWDGQKYEGSKIDNYLENEFYPSLSFKDVIIPKDINQYMYRNKASNFTPTEEKNQYELERSSYPVTQANSIIYYYYPTPKTIENRHVYLLDIIDIASYLYPNEIRGDHTPCDIHWKREEITTMFWGSDCAPEAEWGSGDARYAWLRSASGSFSFYAYYVNNIVNPNSSHAIIYDGDCKGAFGVRPAFVIDLTKCEYTK